MNMRLAKSIVLHHLQGKAVDRGCDFSFSIKRLVIDMDNYKLGRVLKMLEDEGKLIQINSKNASRKTYKTKLMRNK